MGQSGPPGTTGDYFALDAVGALLGGPTGSRLTQSLREERPLTYSVAHRPVWRRINDPSSIFGSANVDAPKTDSAVAVWLDELKGVAGSRPPVEKELEFARAVTVGSLPTRIETIDEMANRLKSPPTATTPRPTTTTTSPGSLASRPPTSRGSRSSTSTRRTPGSSSSATARSSSQRCAQRTSRRSSSSTKTESRFRKVVAARTAKSKNRRISADTAIQPTVSICGPRARWSKGAPTLLRPER